MQKVHWHECPVEGLKPVFVEISPAVPTTRQPKVTLEKTKPTTYLDAIKSTPPRTTAATAADAVTVDSTPKRARAEGAPDASAAAPPQVELLRTLGLTVHAVAKDGNCLFHSFAHHFKVCKRSPTEHGAIRTQAHSTMKSKNASFDLLWDRCSTDDQPLATWTDYLAQIATLTKWGGDLELLGAANRYALRIFVIRRGETTVQYGVGKTSIWLIYRDYHFEPLMLDNNPIHSEERRKHANESASYYRLCLDSDATVQRT